jgi:pre-mRNA 3'-end-processing factor FIP1
VKAISQLPTQQQQSRPEESGPDPSTLPPVTAPSSHPTINPAQPRTVDFETDLAALQEKPWRKPGSDISDWFNYGFDEISWEAYIYRRRDVGDLADVYKANVLVRLSWSHSEKVFIVC